MKCKSLSITLVCLTLAVILAEPVSAQTLSPRRSLNTGAAPGCDLAPSVIDSDSPRNAAEARRLAATAQQAVLVGDQVSARDAFSRAVQLNPADDRIVYDLARTHEELADTLSAIGSYCRYLVLAPAGSEASDVRTRLSRLIPADAQKRAEDASVAFGLGLTHFDEGNYEFAVRAFDEAVQHAPSSVEARFNRGLARSAAGQRQLALEDLEFFRASAASVEERLETARAIDILRRPVFSPSTAALRGILPGFGQMYTARPVRGVVVLAATATAVGLSFSSRTSERTIQYTDPNGVPAPWTETISERPMFTTGLAVAAGITLAAAVEAAIFARNSQKGASIVSRSFSYNTPSRSKDGVVLSLNPYIAERGSPGLRFSANF